jgi:intein/homing endonuclease
MQDGSYASENRLEQIEGEFDVYDLAIDSESHNFIANGFVVHNVS